MELQTNPHLIWQLLPGTVLLAISLHFQSRPVKKCETNALIALILGGSHRAFADALRIITPNITWQSVWSDIPYFRIVLIPASWLLLSVNPTGLLRPWIKK